MIRALLLALVLSLSGCWASREETRQGLDDDMRFSTRVMGFALDAHMETLRTQLGVLQAFEDDAKVMKELEARLGTKAQVQAKLERVELDRRSLLEEAQRLKKRWGNDTVAAE